jgi:sulfate/thiosulfate transport system permease protein
VIPGFGPTLGFTVTYLSLLVLIPLDGLAFAVASLLVFLALLTLVAQHVVEWLGRRDAPARED